jgi:hypothetical protein
VVVPVDPFGGRVFEVVSVTPGAVSFDQLGLIQAVDCLS